jgi:flagellar biosynthesis protein FlhG
MRRLYSIGGGKGGSGKSFIAASLGILLAKQGKRVVLVDLDLGASNLHTLLGQKIPEKGLEGFIDKTSSSLENLAMATTIPNLYLISSTKCSLEIANLFYAQKVKVINAIKDLPFDSILLDLGPGTHFNTLDFFLMSPEGLFVTTPEPTAIENTFLFMKSIYLRKLKLSLKEANIWHTCQEETAKLSKGTVKSPLELINILIDREPEKGKIFEELLSSLKFRLIVNKFRGQVSENLGEQLVEVCNTHLYPSFSFLGNISYDNRVYESILARNIFIRKYPYTKTVSDIQQMVRNLLDERQGSGRVEVQG